MLDLTYYQNQDISLWYAFSYSENYKDSHMISEFGCLIHDIIQLKRKSSIDLKVKFKNEISKFA